MRYLVLLLVCACATPKPVAVGTVDVLTDEARITEQTLGGAALALPYEIDNRSGQAATLDAVLWRLEVDGEPAQSGDQKPHKPVAAGAKLDEELHIEMRLATSAADFLRRGGAAAQHYTAHATFTLVTPSGTSQFEAEWAGELPPSRRPAVVVQPQAVRAEGNAELLFVLGIRNPNAFALPITRLAYIILVEGEEIATGELGRGERVLAGSEIQFDITRFVGREDHVELALKILKQTDVGYAVHTTLETGEYTFTDTHAAAMSFGSSGAH